jgi:hypothetical protein
MMSGKMRIAAVFLLIIPRQASIFSQTVHCSHAAAEKADYEASRVRCGTSYITRIFAILAAMTDQLRKVIATLWCDYSRITGILFRWHCHCFGLMRAFTDLC